MTQLNSMHPEKIFGNETDLSEQSKADKQMKSVAKFAAILLAIVGIAFFGYAMSVVTFTDPEDYILVGFPLILAGASITGFYFIQRDRLALGGGIVFVLNLFLPIVLTSIVKDTLWHALLYATISSTLLILRASPRRSRRWSTVTAALLLGVVVVINLIDPPGRFLRDPQLTTFMTIVIAVLFLAFMVQAVRQSWLQNNIRARFLTLSLGLTFLTAIIIGAVSVNSLLSAGVQAQETSSDVLRNQTQETLAHQTYEAALKNDIVLNKISQDAQSVAKQTAHIFENPEAYSTNSLWIAEERMFVGAEGQYINRESDTSTVFVPNTVTINQNFNQQLERLAFLDAALVSTLEGNPDTVAIYFIGKDEISWLYPNINLGQLVPADFLATEDIFYSTGTPENNPNGEVVWTPVYNDPAGQGLLVSAIAPVYVNNDFMGVIGIDVSLAGLTENISNEDFGREGEIYAFLIDETGKALALPEQGYRDMLARERLPGEFGTELVGFAKNNFSSLFENILSGETGFETVQINDQELLFAYTPLSSTTWYLTSVADSEQVLAPAAALRTQLQDLTESLVLQRILPIGVVLILLVVMGGVNFTNRLVNPIERLSEGAAKIGLGEWDTQLPHSDLQEINSLSTILSKMAAQIKEMVETLEQRIEKRTSNLRLAAEVGQTISQVSDLDIMLNQAATLILQQFDLYYVQIYLTDKNKTKLTLQSGTGEVGKQLLARQHSLLVSAASINGRAALERKSVVIPDTDKSPTFRKNVLLPETRGEMAIPLIVGDRVVGVLDMQSNQPDILTEEELPAFEALAGQLAVAIQNASLIEETEQARAEIEAQARRQVRRSWNEHMDGVHRAEEIGFSFDRNAVTPLDHDNPLPAMDEEKVLKTPISWIGEEIGSLLIEFDEENDNEQTLELVNTVARQVAQQLENLRLLENAERYLNEAEEASRRQTREGWEEYISARSGESMGYAYDSTKVSPYNNTIEETQYAFSLPVKAGNAEIGKLAVDSIDMDDKESLQFANAVAERLGAHIENLRLAERTRQSLNETAEQTERLGHLNEYSEALSQAETLDEIYNTTAKILPTIIDAKRFSMSHPTEDGEMLEVFALQGEGGAIPTGTKLPIAGTAIGTCFTERRGVIDPDLSENTYKESGLLAKQGLKSTLSVPLVVAGESIGTLNFANTKVRAYSTRDQDLAVQAASLMASTIENRQQYQRAQKQADREAMLNTISQKIQSATTVEAVLQIAARELGHALGAPMTVAQLNIKEQK